MPFDQLTYEPDDVVIRQLMKGRARLAAGWCKGSYVRDGSVCGVGAIVVDDRNKIVCEILYGEHAVFEYLARAIPGPRDVSAASIGQIQAYNDHPYRTKEEMLALYDRAIDKRRQLLIALPSAAIA